MKNKKLVVFFVVFAITITIILVISIRFVKTDSDINSNNESTSMTSTTESTIENIEEENTEIIESLTEEIKETTSAVFTTKTAETTTEKVKETTTKKVEATTKASVKETTTNKPETTTEAAKTMFTANLNTSSPTALELALFNAVNEEREKAGVAKLKWNDNLHFFARKRAEEVTITKNHTRPDGTKFYTIYKEYGVTNTNTSENIVYGETNPELIVEGYIDAWMNSPSHKEAILNPANKYAAIGITTGPDGIIYAVNLFHK